ncbi:17196_t:CDS:2, partial [Racocetra persica]
MLSSDKESDPVVLSDTPAQPDMLQAGLESNLECLSLEALRFVCKVSGVPDSGQKKEVVARLVKEGKVWLGPDATIDVSEVPGKGKDVQPQPLENRSESLLEDPDMFQWTGDRSQQLRSGVQNPRDSFKREAMLGSNLAHNRPWNKGAMNWGAYFSTLTLNDVKRKDMWEKHELLNQRNQWEAYMVRVADEDGWEVAFKIATADLSDPISEILESKRERARLATQCNYCITLVWNGHWFRPLSFKWAVFPQHNSHKHNCIFINQDFTNNSQISQQGFSPNAALPSLGQQVFSPSPYWSKKGDKNKWSKRKDVVCYLCKRKEHFANECSSRKHLGLPFRGNSHNREIVDYTQEVLESVEEEEDKILGENNKAVSDNAKVIKGGNSFVSEKFNAFSNQFKPEALSFYTGGDALVERRVAEIRDCRGY